MQTFRTKEIVSDYDMEVNDPDFASITSIVGENPRGTTRFQWKILRREGETKGATLQQLWIGSSSAAWIDVPVVVDDDDGGK